MRRNSNMRRSPRVNDVFRARLTGFRGRVLENPQESNNQHGRAHADGDTAAPNGFHRIVLIGALLVDT